MGPKIRLALFSEQRELARVYTAAFWDDILFGDLIHPHRKEFPEDNQLYWLRRIQVYWWDYTHHFIVSTAVDKQGDEVIAGVAHWSRMGTGRRAAGLGWWDPRKSDLELVIASRRTVLPLVRSYSHREIAGAVNHEIPCCSTSNFFPHFLTHVQRPSRQAYSNSLCETVFIHVSQPGCRPGKRVHHRALLPVPRAHLDGVSQRVLVPGGVRRSS